MYVPANTVLTATARINGERMELTVSSIAYKGTVVPVELEVYEDLGRGAIQGLSQYLATKFRTVKVTLKANHAVLLVAKK